MEALLSGTTCSTLISKRQMLGRHKPVHRSRVSSEHLLGQRGEAEQTALGQGWVLSSQKTNSQNQDSTQRPSQALQASGQTWPTSARESLPPPQGRGSAQGRFRKRPSWEGGATSWQWVPSSPQEENGAPGKGDQQTDVPESGCLQSSHLHLLVQRGCGGTPSLTQSVPSGTDIPTAPAFQVPCAPGRPQPCPQHPQGQPPSCPRRSICPDGTGHRSLGRSWGAFLS